MNEVTKRLIVLTLNLAAGLVLGLANIYEWALPWWGSVTTIVVVVLDTWAAIEWIPPKRKS